MGGAEGGGRISDEQRARMRQTLRLAFEAPMTLTIAQSDSTVTLVADTTRLVLYSDGRKLKQAVAGGGDVEIKGRWQGNDFVVERQVSGGGKVTEDYQRAPDGKRLYVLVNLDPGRGRSVDFRRIYEPAGS